MPYEIGNNNALIHVNPEDPKPIVIANFHALAHRQTILDDGTEEPEISYEVVAKGPFGERVVTLTPDELLQGQWHIKKLGIQARISLEPLANKRILDSIQILSKQIEIHTIYTVPGWNADGHFITSGCVISPASRQVAETQFSSQLKKYALPIEPAGKEMIRDTLTYSLQIPDWLTKRNPELGVAALASLVRSPLGNADYAVHIAGPSGVFKTELAMLMMSHFGSEVTAKDITASWASTGNAIEKVAWLAKDTLIVVDDFAPTGNVHSVARLHDTAERVIRAAGNQAGRSRMTDDDAHLFPRCLILSTGEDVPKGESLRARMLTVEATIGDIESQDLAKYQNLRRNFVHWFADYIQWLSTDLAAHRNEIREQREATQQQESFAHARTATMLGDLSAALTIFGRYASRRLDSPAVLETIERYKTHLRSLAAKQALQVIEEQHHEKYLRTIREMFEEGLIYVTPDNEAGSPPSGKTPSGHPIAGKLGWRKKEQFWSIEDHAKSAGYYEPLHGAIALKPDMVFRLAQARLTKNGESIPIGRSTLHKRLNDYGCLDRTDETRKRLIVEKMVQGQTAAYLLLKWDSVFPDDPLGDDLGMVMEEWHGEETHHPRSSGDFV